MVHFNNFELVETPTMPLSVARFTQKFRIFFFWGGGVRFCMQDLEDAALCTVVKFLQDGYDLVIFDKLITFWGSSKFRPSDS